MLPPPLEKVIDVLRCRCPCEFEAALHLRSRFGPSFQRSPTGLGVGAGSATSGRRVGRCQAFREPNYLGSGRQLPVSPREVCLQDLVVQKARVEQPSASADLASGVLARHNPAYWLVLTAHR
jgi:hypothetical protein